VIVRTVTIVIMLAARLSKLGFYVGTWEVSEIVDCKIESWIVRSYII